VTSECVSNGGCYTDVQLAVPPLANGGAVRDGVLGGGVCGGWDSSIASDFEIKHQRCRELAPAGFYTDTDDCRDKFMTSGANSLFRYFELHTFDKARQYDAPMWDGGALVESVNNGSPEMDYDPDLLAQAEDICVQTRQTIDDRSQDAMDASKPVDSMLLAIVSHCKYDVYRNLASEWTTAKMTEHVCTAIAPKMDYERRDMACADHKIRNDDTITNAIIGNDRKACSTCSPARTEATVIEGVLADALNMEGELTGSLGATKVMSYSACSSYVTATPLDGLDCDAHVFRDTQTWSCGVPSAPTNGRWQDGSCTSTDLNAVCTSECRPSYYSTSGAAETLACTKIGGVGLADVDVDTGWVGSTVTCVPCTNCYASLHMEEMTGGACTATADTVCGCAAGYASLGGACEECAINTYADQPGKVWPCHSCPAGFTASNGETSCS